MKIEDDLMDNIVVIFFLSSQLPWQIKNTTPGHFNTNYIEMKAPTLGIKRPPAQPNEPK